MKATMRLILSVLVFLSVWLGVYPAIGQQPITDLPINQTTSYKGEEFLLIGSATRGAGEPIIAINPKDPNIIIVGAMSNLHYVEGEKFAAPGRMVSQDTISVYRNTPDSSISIYAISYDRGKTWRYFEDPFRDFSRMNTTADTFVGADGDGTLFIGAMSFFPLNASPLMIDNEKDPTKGQLYGGIDIASSSDNGKTWGTPVRVMGQSTPREEYAPEVNPVFKGTTPYDRPFLITDQSTGTIYVSGDGVGGDPVHMENYFRVSNDKGKTWGLIRSFDSPDYPQAGFGSRSGAANGVLGVAYMASKAPASSGAKCPCLVFGVSRDEGKTMERYIVQSEVPPMRGFFGFGNPSLAADPSHRGRFAVMSLADAGATMQIFVTEDFGKTWKGPVKAGSVPGAIVVRPDIGYSPKGDLAVMWRSMKPDNTYSLWSAASHDGGATFSKPLQVSQAPSPARESILYRGNNWDGDDLSSIAVDNDFVHVVWADGRAGFMGAWYARIPLTSY
jgi:hypothetical protein